MFVPATRFLSASLPMEQENYFGAGSVAGSIGLPFAQTVMPPLKEGSNRGGGGLVSRVVQCVQIGFTECIWRGARALAGNRHKGWMLVKARPGGRPRPDLLNCDDVQNMFVRRVPIAVTFSNASLSWHPCFSLALVSFGQALADSRHLLAACVLLWHIRYVGDYCSSRFSSAPICGSLPSRAALRSKNARPDPDRMPTCMHVTPSILLVFQPVPSPIAGHLSLVMGLLDRPLGPPPL